MRPTLIILPFAYFIASIIKLINDRYIRKNACRSVIVFDSTHKFMSKYQLGYCYKNSIFTFEK